jgi:hypothetical protein
MADFTLTIGADGYVTYQETGSSALKYHPRDRELTFPKYPRVPIANAAYAAPKAQLTALIAAGSFDAAINLVTTGGFSLLTSDVAGGSLAAFKAFVVQRVTRQQDSGLDAGFWT